MCVNRYSTYSSALKRVYHIPSLLLHHQEHDLAQMCTTNIVPVSIKDVAVVQHLISSPSNVSIATIGKPLPVHNVCMLCYRSFDDITEAPPQIDHDRMHLSGQGKVSFTGTYLVVKRSKF